MVLISVSCVEVSLTCLLQAALFPAPTKYDNLFDAERSCSLFAAKSALAVRMSVISTHGFEALEALRKLRDRFAHSTDTLSLNDPSAQEFLQVLRDECGHHPAYSAYHTLVSATPSQEWRNVFSPSCFALITAFNQSRETIRPFNFTGRGQVNLKQTSPYLTLQRTAAAVTPAASAPPPSPTSPRSGRASHAGR